MGNTNKYMVARDVTFIGTYFAREQYGQGIIGDINLGNTVSD